MNTTLSTLTTAVDDRFETTITYIDDNATEYTDQAVEALRNEGYIQEAITQILAWASSDEGKRFRKSYGQESVLNGHHSQVEDHLQNY